MDLKCSVLLISSRIAHEHSKKRDHDDRRTPLHHRICPDRFAVATIAFGGTKMTGNALKVAEAQLAVSGEKGKYPEFKGNVVSVDTRPFNKSGTRSAHYGGDPIFTIVSARLLVVRWSDFWRRRSDLSLSETSSGQEGAA